MTYSAEQITYMLAEAIDQNREYKSWHCSTQHLMALVERVVADEREACAKLRDTLHPFDLHNRSEMLGVMNQGLDDYQNLIRARGTT